MFLRTDYSANHYRCLPGDDSGVTATKFTRLTEDDAILRLPQSVKSVVNTQQTLKLITGINACIKKLGIDASAGSSNTASLAEQLNKLEMITQASRRGNEEKLTLTEEILFLDKKTINNNTKMIYQIEESNKPFFRFKKNKVKGYNKNFTHICKKKLSKEYNISVENTKKLVGTPTAKNVKEKLIQFNKDKTQTVANGYNALLTLTTQRNMHDEILKKINELRDNLSTAATANNQRETQSAEFTVAERRETAEILTGLADANQVSTKTSPSEQTVTQQDYPRESAASSSAVINLKKRPAPPQ